ncbi:MAG: hypothetical protein BWX56_00158 [Euryarchaeota archaeon ADurb.Bin023]|nr:MAG: hypothetical protein BWX56_00158 [Euryarchaeota archaeon ADurb.Bin023]
MNPNMIDVAKPIPIEAIAPSLVALFQYKPASRGITNEDNIIPIPIHINNASN